MHVLMCNPCHVDTSDMRCYSLSESFPVLREHLGCCVWNFEDGVRHYISTRSRSVILV